MQVWDSSGALCSDSYRSKLIRHGVLNCIDFKSLVRILPSRATECETSGGNLIKPVRADVNGKKPADVFAIRHTVYAQADGVSF